MAAAAFSARELNRLGTNLALQVLSAPWPQPCNVIAGAYTHTLVIIVFCSPTTHNGSLADRPTD